MYWENTIFLHLSRTVLLSGKSNNLHACFNLGNVFIYEMSCFCLSLHKKIISDSVHFHLSLFAGRAS